MGDSLYFVLPYPLPEKEIPSLMCRVVASPLSPARKFIPNPDESDPLVLSNILPNLLPDPIPVESTASINSANNTSLKARLPQLFSHSSESFTNQALELTGEIQRYTLTQNEWKFRKLLENSRFAREVAQLVRDNGGIAYMISGFMACRESTWKRSSGNGSSHAGQIKFRGVDMNAINGEGSKGTEGEIRERLVFAIAYDVIGAEWYFEWNATYFPKVKSRVSLKSELRADWNQLSMAGEEDEIFEYDEEDDDDKRVLAANLLLTWMSKQEFDRLQSSAPNS
jgi:hypothetical protein